MYKNTGNFLTESIMNLKIEAFPLENMMYKFLLHFEY